MPRHAPTACGLASAGQPVVSRREGPVVREGRIATRANVGQPGRARTTGRRLVGCHAVHERHRRSGRVDGRPRVGDVGQRLATERSAEMAEEDHQRRAICVSGSSGELRGIGDGRQLHLVIS